ncbi:MAG: LamG domain-containing protein [Candidatus Aenigmarchaeota archaeon]|nr:LamG domain-containing protein [Candidatus Aenigmarchaeota archaeon]MDW8149205.1 LamG domain-containing protein [Candidatus Aenigmarchaeota archaeon]
MNEIISIVLLVVMTISLVSIAFIFANNIIAGRVVDIIEIVYFDEENRKILVRNIGTSNINELNVFVDGKKEKVAIVPAFDKLLYLSFNEGEGSEVKDSGRNKIGVLINNPVWTKTPFSYGLKFADNVYDSSVIINDFNINFSNFPKLQFVARVYTTIDQTANDWNYFIYVKDEYNMPVIEFGTWGDIIVFKPFSGYTGYHVGNIPIEKNKWNYIVGIIDGSSIKLYVNGNLVASRNDFNGFKASSINKLYIGGCQNRVFDGVIDEIGIFTNFGEEEISFYTNGIIPPAKLSEIEFLSSGIVGRNIRVCSRSNCQVISYIGIS